MCQSSFFIDTLLFFFQTHFTMKQKKNNSKHTINLDDYLKASRIGNREAEKEIKGPGFHATSRIHKSKKTYTRKIKHKRLDS